MRRVGLLILVLISAFYAYGALVHVLNMAGLRGFNWLSAPVKWQILDVVYLGLDLVVAFGLWQRWRASIVAFYVAAVSQIALYTIGRSWIMDVPEAFAQGPEAMAYLNGLVVFHLLSLVLVSLALRAAPMRA